MSRFPKLTETFILYEMEALARAGWRVEVFPLLRETASIHHKEAATWVERAHYIRYRSPEVVSAHLYWWRHRPRQFLRLWRDILWGHRASAKFLTRALAVLWLAPQMALRMQQVGVQHVHAHWATHPTLAALVIRRLAGIPYSFTGHAHDLYVDRTMLAEKIDEARFVVTISEHNHRLLRDLYGARLARKVHVIHCGVDTDLFQERTPGANGQLTVICVGSLEAKKGQRYLVDACQLLVQRNIPFRCWFVGDGEMRPSLQTQVDSLGLQEHVRFWGQQPRTQLLSLLSQADVMVLPSVRLSTGKQEGIPVALMEALAVGIPAVASDLSGIPELIEHGKTGLLVPERDPTALADAIARLYHEPALGQALATAGRRKVTREFDLKRNVAALANLFAKTAVPQEVPAGSALSEISVEGYGGPR